MSEPATSRASDASNRFTLRQRILLSLIAGVGHLAIRLIGMTLRFSYSAEEGAPPNRVERPAVYAFWHRCIFPAAYFFRNERVRVMTSRSFDGEYIARIIEKLGFIAVRGSSSRGAVGALLGMRRDLEQGEAVAFTIDGPRGPRYIAKPGPVLLAKKSGAPLAAFYVALQDPWVLNSWDAMMIPKPFSRAVIRMSREIRVPSGADEVSMQAFHAELQSSLERVQKFAEENVEAF